MEDAADNDEYADKDFENLVKQFRVDEKMCYFHSQVRYLLSFTFSYMVHIPSYVLMYFYLLGTTISFTTG